MGDKNTQYTENMNTHLCLNQVTIPCCLSGDTKAFKMHPAASKIPREGICMGTRHPMIYAVRTRYKGTMAIVPPWNKQGCSRAPEW